MNYYELGLLLFLLLLCVVLTGLWQREKGRAIGWNDCFFNRIEHERRRRNNLGQFRKQDAPTHEWRVAR